MRIQFKEWMTPAAVGVISFVAGVGSGYFLKKYRDSAKFDTSIQDAAADITALEEDVNQMRFEFNENLERMNSVVQQANHVIVKFIDGTKEAVAQVLEVKSVEPIQHVDVPKVTHPAAKNRSTSKKAQEKQKMKIVEPDDVFPVSENEDWNYTEELKHRSEERPYILHRDEFFSNENDYRQCSLTYYEGDNILCDEQDVPVYNPEKIVGELIFGHGSSDPSIVYIRNDRLEAEYEVILDHGYYQTEVLGHEIEDAVERNELKHGVQRFRMTD